VEEEKVAHTAEHAFIGALQKILGQTLKVRKVEHKKNSNNDNNTAFIAIPKLDIDTVIRAEHMVNALISEGREVTVRTYASLEDAKRDNPILRANDERISGEVRVVEIANHDVTACVREHVQNLKECEFFLVTRLSKSGGEYEVDFAVGRRAKDTAISLSAKLMAVCSELGANLNTVENTAKKVKREGESSFKRLKVLSREKLQSIAPVTNGVVKLYRGVFSGLADEALQEFAGEMIAEPNTVVAVVNIYADAEEDSTGRLIFARNETMKNLDCNKTFREVVGVDGKGGGRPHFVIGIVKGEKAKEIVDKISDNILRST
jgi:alanyl-tRNA synthetase